jgi:hypothetical protein
MIGGAVGASAGVGVWWIAQMASRNLPATSRVLVPVALAVFTVFIGFLVGAAIGRRASRYPERIALFSTVATGFGGAIIGAALAVTIASAYLASYGNWPEDTLGRVLFVLALPAFGGLGWFAGATVGSIVGLTGGTILCLLNVSRR